MPQPAPSMDELREMIAGLSRSQAETDRQIRRTDEQLRQTDEHLRQTDEQLKELGRQLGGLGDKFGSFTEGMAYPSMRKLLEERFGMNVIAPRVLARRNGHHLELDVLAYSNGDRDEVYIVEIKSHLREDGLQQMLRILEEFPRFFPEHRDKELYGILATVDAPEDLEAEVLKHGIYLARIHGDVFELRVPEDFQPRSFQPPQA